MTTSAELPIGTAIWSSRGRLRTVALANATSSEHTLNPQTPRVKREPLLRIRGNRIYVGLATLYPSPNRECLYKVASPGKTPEKTESMLDWPLYTPSPNREYLYKVASPGKTPEKTESMLDWPLYTPSPNRECLYKVASPGKTPEKTHFYLEWPLYTPASRLQDFDPETEGLTTRYRGKTTTERYNGKATTRKWDMSRLYTFIVFNVSYRLAMIGILNML